MGTVLAYAISCGTGRKAMELRSANIVSTGDSRKRSHCLVAQVPFLNIYPSILSPVCAGKKPRCRSVITLCNAVVYPCARPFLCLVC